MAVKLPNYFQTLSGGNEPASALDSNFSDLAQYSIIQCAVGGTANAITLTPGNSITVGAYTDIEATLFSFVASANSTGSVTVNVAALGNVNAYQPDGTTQLGSGDITSGTRYLVVYRGSLNSSSGGVQVIYGGPVTNKMLATMAANTIKGNNTGSTANAADLTAAQAASILSLANRNFLIGGDFTTNPWQRGTSFAGLSTATVYTADRWAYGFGGVSSSFTISKATDAPSGFLNSLKWQRLAANADTTATWIGQAIESVNATALQGKKVTLSFWAKAGANWSPTSGILHTEIDTGTGIDEGWSGSVVETWAGWTAAVTLDQAITTSWVRYQTAGTIGASVTEIAVNFRFAPVGTAGANDWAEIAGVQLEIGGAATAFDNVPVSRVVRDCRRYCRIASVYVPATTAQNLATLDMRAIPTITGGGAGFTSTGTTADSLIAYQTSGSTQTLTLSAEL